MLTSSREPRRLDPALEEGCIDWELMTAKESTSSEATLWLGQRGRGKHRYKLKVNNNLQSDGDRKQ